MSLLKMFVESEKNEKFLTEVKSKFSKKPPANKKPANKNNSRGDSRKTGEFNDVEDTFADKEFDDYVGSNMYFQMTKSGKLAGDE